LLLCTWPDAEAAPMVPAPYAEEVWTGLEYASASHMLLRGLASEALTIVEAARARYDGRRRNPYSDIECGSYYVRALSAWALVNAWSGLDADMREDSLAFRPAERGGWLFWSAGTGWGKFWPGEKPRLEVLGGHIALRRLRIADRDYVLPRRQILVAGESWSPGAG
jgi:hypothetical protein